MRANVVQVTSTAASVEEKPLGLLQRPALRWAAVALGLLLGLGAMLMVRGLKSPEDTRLPDIDGQDTGVASSPEERKPQESKPKETKLAVNSGPKQLVARRVVLNPGKALARQFRPLTTVPLKAISVALAVPAQPPELLPVAPVSLKAGGRSTLSFQLDAWKPAAISNVRLEGLPQGIKAGRAVIDLPRQTVRLELTAARDVNEANLQARIHLTIAQWSIEGLAPIRVLQPVIRKVVSQAEEKGPVRCVAISPDSWRAAWGTADGGVRLENLPRLPRSAKNAGKERHQRAVTCLAFRKDAKELVSASEDGSVLLWNVGIGGANRQSQDAGVLSVAFEGDGRSILCGRDDGFAQLLSGSRWKDAGGKPMQHLGPVLGVAFLPEGRRALTLCEDSIIRIWDVATARVLHEFSILPAQGIACMASSADGQQVLTGGGDSAIRLWDIKTGKVIRTLKGHTKAVRSVVFSQDGRRALSGSNDRTLRLWDLQTAEELRRFEGHEDEVLSVALASDGRWAVSGGYDGSVRVWAVPK